MMKRISLYILIPVIYLLAFSCDNAFLLEESFFGESSLIAISPSWEAYDYEIQCQGVGNAGFTIVQAPAWLNVSAVTGQFMNSTALLNCKANTYSDFSETGIYYSYLTLSVEGKGNLAVPVAYITEGNPVIEVESHVNIDYNGRMMLPVKNTGDGILLCNIAQHPAWLTLNQSAKNTAYIIPSNGQEYLQFNFNPDVPLSEDISGKIVIVTNDKDKPVVEVSVQMDLGNPMISSNVPGTIDFGRTETTRSFYFYNQGNGYLVWKIEGCPEWLTVSPSNGITLGGYITLSFTCNRERMATGQNTAVIYLKSNDKNKPSHPITVTAYNNAGNPDNVKDIQGNITDACINKKTDMLYLTTSQPNRFLAFDTRTKSIVRELSLSYAPTCFSISEDGRQAVIGHGGYISTINMNNFTVSKIMEVNYNLFDIEWGAGGWICYSPGQEVQSYQLEWICPDSSKTYTVSSGTYYLYGKTLIKKIPQQNYIVASRLMISPSGISVFDNRTLNQVSYFHEETNDFWFSSDGYYLFSSFNKIYRTTSLIYSSSSLFVSPIGTFSPAPYRIHCIDHSPASHSVWVLSSTNYYDDGQRLIMQYEDNDFTRKNIYYYSDYYNNRAVHAHYVFANQAGTELVVIRNVTVGDNLWSLEFIPISM